LVKANYPKGVLEMKKALLMVMCILLIAAAFHTVSAAGLDANKQKVVDALKSSITVNGKEVTLPADLLNQAENYLKRDDVTITSAQADSIVDYVESALDLVKNSGATTISGLSASEKTELLSIINDAAAVADLTVVTDFSKNTISVLADGKVVATDEPALKVTGMAFNAFAVLLGFGVLALTGCFVAARKAKLFA
jgi:hypothetical protein